MKKSIIFGLIITNFFVLIHKFFILVRYLYYFITFNEVNKDDILLKPNYVRIIDGSSVSFISFTRVNVSSILEILLQLIFLHTLIALFTLVVIKGPKLISYLFGMLALLLAVSQVLYLLMPKSIYNSTYIIPGLYISLYSLFVITLLIDFKKNKHFKNFLGAFASITIIIAHVISISNQLLSKGMLIFLENHFIIYIFIDFLGYVLLLFYFIIKGISLIPKKQVINKPKVNIELTKTLLKYKDLYDRGLISEQDYQALKKNVLIKKDYYR